MNESDKWQLSDQQRFVLYDSIQYQRLIDPSILQSDILPNHSFEGVNKIIDVLILPAQSDVQSVDAHVTWRSCFLLIASGRLLHFKFPVPSFERRSASHRLVSICHDSHAGHYQPKFITSINVANDGVRSSFNKLTDQIHSRTSFSQTIFHVSSWWSPWKDRDTVLAVITDSCIDFIDVSHNAKSAYEKRKSKSLCSVSCGHVITAVSFHSARAGIMIVGCTDGSIHCFEIVVDDTFDENQLSTASDPSSGHAVSMKPSARSRYHSVELCETVVSVPVLLKKSASVESLAMFGTSTNDVDWLVAVGLIGGRLELFELRCTSADGRTEWRLHSIRTDRLHSSRVISLVIMPCLSSTCLLESHSPSSEHTASMLVVSDQAASHQPSALELTKACRSKSLRSAGVVFSCDQEGLIVLTLATPTVICSFQIKCHKHDRLVSSVTKVIRMRVSPTSRPDCWILALCDDVHSVYILAVTLVHNETEVMPLSSEQSSGSYKVLDELLFVHSHDADSGSLVDITFLDAQRSPWLVSSVDSSGNLSIWEMNAALREHLGLYNVNSRQAKHQIAGQQLERVVTRFQSKCDEFDRRREILHKNPLAVVEPLVPKDTSRLQNSPNKRSKQKPNSPKKQQQTRTLFFSPSTEEWSDDEPPIAMKRAKYHPNNQSPLRSSDTYIDEDYEIDILH